MESLPMSKDILRQQYLQQRRQLDPSLRARLDEMAQTRLLASNAYCDAKVIALYSPARGEVDTALILAAALRDGKKVVYPRVAGEQLVFVPVLTESDLSPGAFAINEPVGSDLVPVPAIDLMLLPGLAFSRDGHRLGSGKGFYDRTLGCNGRPGILAGLAYDFQLNATLPFEAHDVCLDLLVTDARVLAFAPLITP